MSRTSASLQRSLLAILPMLALVQHLGSPYRVPTNDQGRTTNAGRLVLGRSSLVQPPTDFQKAVLGILILGHQAQAQGPVSITIFEENYAVQSINNPATVNYTPNIEVRPAGAALECTPPSGGQFPRGATLVTCTATLGSASDTASFYVLVANGDDTDVAIFTFDLRADNNSFTATTQVSPAQAPNTISIPLVRR